MTNLAFHSSASINRSREYFPFDPFLSFFPRWSCARHDETFNSIHCCFYFCRRLPSNRSPCSSGLRTSEYKNKIYKRDTKPAKHNSWRRWAWLGHKSIAHSAPNVQRNDSSSPLQRNKPRLRLKQRMFRYWQKFNIRVVCRVVCGS